MMGGIDTDVDGATTLPGLYAAGECACVSINGANRLGSNSLTELVVFGARAGRHAAAAVARQELSDGPEIDRQVAAELDRLTELRARPAGGERIAVIRDDLTTAMEAGAGIFRDKETLDSCCATLRELHKRAANISLDDSSPVYNTELISALELDCMLDIADTVTHSALHRTESRGSHQRTDHAARDDANFLKHSMAYRTDADPRIEFKDVVITRWPPAERVYGTSADKDDGKRAT